MCLSVEGILLLHEVHLLIFFVLSISLRGNEEGGGGGEGKINWRTFFYFKKEILTEAEKKGEEKNEKYHRNH